LFKDTYRSQLDAVEWTEEERDRVIAEVALAFRFNTELFDDLASAKAAA
jgi:heme oxygenase